MSYALLCTLFFNIFGGHGEGGVINPFFRWGNWGSIGLKSTLVLIAIMAHTAPACVLYEELAGAGERKWEWSEKLIRRLNSCWSKHSWWPFYPQTQTTGAFFFIYVTYWESSHQPSWGMCLAHSLAPQAEQGWTLSTIRSISQYVVHNIAILPSFLMGWQSSRTEIFRIPRPHCFGEQRMLSEVRKPPEQCFSTSESAGLGWRVENLHLWEVPWRADVAGVVWRPLVEKL